MERYFCDRCKIEIPLQDTWRNKIHFTVERPMVGKTDNDYDLCSDCGLKLDKLLVEFEDVSND